MVKRTVKPTIDSGATIGANRKSAPPVITPEQFLAGYPLDLQILAHELRLLIKATLPDVVEKVAPGWQLIGYRSPTQRGTVYFCAVAPKADRVDLYFEHGVLMHDPEARLMGAQIMKQMRYIPIRSMADIQPEPIRVLLLEAVRASALSKTEKELIKAARKSG